MWEWFKFMLALLVCVALLVAILALAIWCRDRNEEAILPDIASIVRVIHEHRADFLARTASQ